MTADLNALAARVEAATADDQREVLESAWNALHPGLQLPAPGAYWPPQFTRFIAMLDAEAYESAALMLVPEGKGFSIERPSRFLANRIADTTLHCSAEVFPLPYRKTRAATPALALVAASLRSRAAQGEVM